MAARTATTPWWWDAESRVEASQTRKDKMKTLLGRDGRSENSTTAGFSPGRGYVTVTVNEAFPNWFRTFPSQKQETLEGHKKLFSLIH